MTDHGVDVGGSHLLNELDSGLRQAPFSIFPFTKPKGTHPLSRLLVSLSFGDDELVVERAHVLLERAVPIVVVGRLESLAQPSRLGVRDGRKSSRSREDHLGLLAANRSDDVATVCSHPKHENVVVEPRVPQ